MFCLSEYLHLRNVYILLIRDEPEGLFREEITNRHLQSSRVVSRYCFFFFKGRLGLPVVRKVSSVVTKKYIAMYILHYSSFVLCFSNISAYFSYSEVMGKVKVVAGGFLSPRSSVWFERRNDKHQINRSAYRPWQ